MTSQHSKRLLVEGRNDLFTVVNVMKAHVTWPDRPFAPVHIVERGNDAAVLDISGLSTEIKQTGTLAVGMIIDGDADPAARWKAIHLAGAHIGCAMPAAMPPTGLIVQSSFGPKFGAWIMPDNVNPGILESFAALLVPPAQAAVLKYTGEALDEARKRGAQWKDAHRDKARLHTFLSWSDEPGKPIGQAVQAKVLDPAAASAMPFVTWMKTLFDLT
jgi:hypothetical protein